MYGIYTYIWLIFMVNVGKYTIHGSYGYVHPYLEKIILVFTKIFQMGWNHQLENVHRVGQFFFCVSKSPSPNTPSIVFFMCYLPTKLVDVNKCGSLF